MKIRLQSGFTLVELMIVVAIVGLLSSIAMPSYVAARRTSQRTACINNLRLIDSAKQQWALETNQPADSVPADDGSDIAPYLGYGGGSIANVVCPSSGRDGTFATSYVQGGLGTAPTCLILPARHVLE